MAARRRPANRQAELFPRSKQPVIAIDPNHRLVQSIRLSKRKNEAGRPPRLRALTGALVFRALRHRTYQDTEDLIRHYAPARYLCALTESDGTPDANTIQDFEQLLGEDKLADPQVVFVSAVAVASKNVGSALKGFVARATGLFETAKRKLREFRLFAKNKTKAARIKLMAQMAGIVDGVQRQLARGLDCAARQRLRLARYRKVAWEKLQQLHGTMQTLLPQIRYRIKTGWVAANKIVSLQIPETYAIVRGKVGKAVEFGLNWGISRLRGGYLLATMAKDKRELTDSKFVVREVKDHIAIFGKAPSAYAYDRGGWGRDNVAELRKLGVAEVGLAPRGQAQWQVKGKVKDKLVCERAQVEAGIGTIKCRKYGFTRPAAKSVNTMGMCGQRAVLGFNLDKLVRGLAEREGMVLVG